MAYNWSKLKTKFITGDYASLKDFAEREGVPYSLVRKNANKWIEEKRTKEKQKGNKIADRIIDKQVDRAVAINERHLSIYDKLLGIVEDALSTSNGIEAVRGIDSVYKCIKGLSDVVDKAQKGQRLALGMDKEDDNPKGADNVSVIINIADCSNNGGEING